MNRSKSVFHCFHSLSFILVQKDTNADGGSGGDKTKVDQVVETDQVGSELRDKVKKQMKQSLFFCFFLYRI